MVQKVALIFLLTPALGHALPPCADKVDVGLRTSCPDSWLKIPRWVSYRAEPGAATAKSALGVAVAQWVSVKGTLQIYEGPAFPVRDGVSTITWSDGSAVPDSVWAFGISVGKDGKLETIAVLAPKTAPMIVASHLTTIDAIEALTGLDFLAELPDEQENALESSKAPSLWGAPVPPPKPKPKPIPKPVVKPQAAPVRPPGMSDSQWEAQKLWLEGGKLMEAGNMGGARDAFTKCLEINEKRADCSSAIMRTFGL